MKLKLYISAGFLLLQTFSFSQSTTIYLRNSSFEGRPHQGQKGTEINEWIDCGALNFPTETPPDIHPNGWWENNLPASDGLTYLGMVVRDNQTYEFVSQRLDYPLLANQCYSFSINLARASRYVSRTRTTGEMENYTTPIVLRIWGGNTRCEEKQLLAESEPVNNTSWQINKFEFKPKSNINYITFSAYYKTPTLLPYNGNILVDGASAIVKIPCPDQNIVVANNNSKATKTAKGDVIKNESKAIIPKTADTSPTVVVAYKPKILLDLVKENIKTGKTFEIKDLLFQADSAKLNPQSFGILDDVFGFLKANENLIVEIGGHTNNIPSDEYCNKLSTARAKAVAEYLINKGINPSKIQFKGYGKTSPIMSNKTAYGRMKNQRVEIKILSID